MTDSGDDDGSEVVDRESQMDFDEPSPGRNSSLVVSHLNIRSVTNKHDDLQVFFWTTGPLLSYATQTYRVYFPRLMRCGQLSWMLDTQLYSDSVKLGWMVRLTVVR